MLPKGATLLWQAVAKRSFKCGPLEVHFGDTGI